MPHPYYGTPGGEMPTTLPEAAPRATSIRPRTNPVSQSETDQLRAIGYANDDDPAPPINGTGDDRPQPLDTLMTDLDAELRRKRQPPEEPGMWERIQEMLGMGP